MGSMGWAQCFWCPRWTYNPHIIDWISKVLCDTCYGNHLDLVNDGVPPHPNAIDHKANALEIILPPLKICGREVAHHVASFLESPWRPGAGSLPRPRLPGPLPPPPPPRPPHLRPVASSRRLRVIAGE